MAWMKVETSVSRNRKFVKAGPGPSWLWLCGLAYCQEGLTDGFIPREALPYLGVKSAPSMVKHLLSAGLWEAVDGGYQVHDYLSHNKPASEVQRIRGERRIAGAEGGKASGEARRQQVASTPAKQNAKDVEAPREPRSDQIRSDQIRSATDQPVRTHTGGGSIHTSHKAHAACGRICLPAFLHTEFVGRRNHAGADRELRNWYSAVLEEWADDEREPGDPVAFWRARYAEKWPATSAKPAGKWDDWQPQPARVRS